MQPNNVAETFTKANQAFDPTYLNLEYIFYRISQFIANLGDFWRENDVLIKIIVGLVCIFLICLIVYAIMGIVAIYKHEVEELEHEAHEAMHGPSHGHGAHGAAGHHAEAHTSHEEAIPESDFYVRSHKWDRIVDFASSDNENDWRQAILEADIMLDDLLERQGYTGADLGEKLHSAQIGDFVTLNEAWEAHKVRNRVAHEGTKFNLPKREVIRVLGMYEKVFREFNYI